MPDEQSRRAGWQRPRARRQTIISSQKPCRRRKLAGFRQQSERPRRHLQSQHARRQIPLRQLAQAGAALLIFRREIRRLLAMQAHRLRGRHRRAVEAMPATATERRRQNGAQQQGEPTRGHHQLESGAPQLFDFFRMKSREIGLAIIHTDLIYPFTALSFVAGAGAGGASQRLATGGAASFAKRWIYFLSTIDS